MADESRLRPGSQTPRLQGLRRADERCELEGVGVCGRSESCKKKRTGHPSRIEGIIDDVIGRNPHSRNLITAFKPLLLVRERLIGEMKLKPADHSRIDGEKLRQGIPCIEQTPFFSKDDPWDRIGLAVLAALREGFPALAEDAAKIGKIDRGGRDRLFDALWTIGRRRGCRRSMGG